MTLYLEAAALVTEYDGLWDTSLTNSARWMKDAVEILRKVAESGICSLERTGDAFVNVEVLARGLDERGAE